MSENIEKNFVHIIGIGAYKAASTWVHTCLREHPEICTATLKETNFFGSNFEKGFDWYKGLFGDYKEKEHLRAEFSPEYLVNKESAGMIKMYAPDAKLIVSLRNPINKISSRYYYDITIGKKKQRLGLNEWLEKNIEKPSKYFLSVLEENKYSSGLKLYYSLFPKEQICIVLVDDIKKDPKMVISKIYSFLEVNSTFIPESLEKKVNFTTADTVHFPAINRFLFQIQAKVKNSHYANFFVPMLKFCGFNFLAKKLFHINRNHKDENHRELKKEKIRQDLRRELYSLFENDIKETEKLIGKKLDGWKID